MHKHLQTAIQQKLSEHFLYIKSLNVRSIGGGSINETYQIKFNDKKVFAK